MDILNTLKTLAPTVASALAGPMAGAAVSALGGVFGQDKPTLKTLTDVISSAQMTPEQVAQIKQLEMAYQQEEQERQFKYADLEFKDRDSARQREQKTADATNKVLAYTVVGSFIAVVGATLLGYAKVESVLAGTLIGYLSAKAEQVMAYYFGSSRGSDKKTDLLAQADAVK